MAEAGEEVPQLTSRHRCSAPPALAHCPDLPRPRRGGQQWRQTPRHPVVAAPGRVGSVGSSRHPWRNARGGEQHGQAVKGSTVEGRTHPVFRYVEQVGEEQGRLYARQGLSQRLGPAPAPAPGRGASTRRRVMRGLRGQVLLPSARWLPRCRQCLGSFPQRALMPRRERTYPFASCGAGSFDPPAVAAVAARR
jgi:hypothetical protein